MRLGYGADVVHPELRRPVRRTHPGRQGLFAIFTPTLLGGTLVTEPDPAADARCPLPARGASASWKPMGWETRFAQCSTSFNKCKSALCSMHQHAPPFAEMKIGRCTCDSIYDVIIDLRPE